MGPRRRYSMHKRSFRSRGSARSKGPTRTWVTLNTGWTFTAQASTGTSVLMSLEAPTTLNLTADPPEDLTILRIVGDFGVALSGSPATWVLGVIVQDATWTPSGSGFGADSDKRILWSQMYGSQGSDIGWAWYPPGIHTQNGVYVGEAPREAHHIDIAPKVRIEAGKALYLVAWELSGSKTLDVTPYTMRMLFQRSRRR